MSDCKRQEVKSLWIFIRVVVYTKHSCVLLGLRCPTTSGVKAAKITLAWVSVETNSLCSLASPTFFMSITLMLCWYRGPLQCREEESGELLHHANLQVTTDRLGRLLNHVLCSSWQNLVKHQKNHNKPLWQRDWTTFDVYKTRFRMKCHLCVNYIEMQTDPATCDYLIVSGGNRKEERWDMAENEQILTTGQGFMLDIN